MGPSTAVAHQSLSVLRNSHSQAGSASCSPQYITLDIKLVSALPNTMYILDLHTPELTTMIIMVKPETPKLNI